jgi:hypothetical protein
MKTTTESNIRRKARRRGYSVSKYRQGYGHVYCLQEWGNPQVEMYDAELDEIEEFLYKQPTLFQQK